LSRRGGLRSGEIVLVMGAAGGVGTAAVQLARGLGAHVIAGVADEGQAQVALSAGAHEALALKDDFASDVRERSGGRGVDIVVDPLGDRFFGEAIRALAPEGRILVIGFAAGEIPTLRVNRILLRNASGVGVAWGEFLAVEPNVAASCAEVLNELYALGTLRPQIGMKVAFRELPEALNRLGRGEIPGKAIAVLTP
jgi:NADPH2:quinone reductase